MNTMAIVWFLLTLVLSPFAAAAIDFDQGLTPAEEQAADQILAPLMKIYNIVKYGASVIAVLALVWAGVAFITAAGEQAKKDRAKNTGVGVVFGLIIIWIAPVVVQFVFS